MNKLRTIAFLLTLLTLGGCSTHQVMPIPPPQPAPPASSSVEPISPEAGSSLGDQFYQYFQEWRGVKHHDGGLSKSGIDCSGFVYLSYKHVLNKRLPRSTDDQVELGQQIDRVSLQSGDLVFFKIGRKTRHVGIYIGENRFIHVSRKRGVMISDLSLDYWVNSYWQSRRLI